MLDLAYCGGIDDADGFGNVDADDDDADYDDADTNNIDDDDADDDDGVDADDADADDNWCCKKAIVWGLGWAH